MKRGPSSGDARGRTRERQPRCSGPRSLCRTRPQELDPCRENSFGVCDRDAIAMCSPAAGSIRCRSECIKHVTVQSPSKDPLSRRGRGPGRGIKSGWGLNGYSSIGGQSGCRGRRIAPGASAPGKQQGHRTGRRAPRGPRGTKRRSPAESRERTWGPAGQPVDRWRWASCRPGTAEATEGINRRIRPGCCANVGPRARTDARLPAAPNPPPHRCGCIHVPPTRP
jgi:hypothetical protein